MIHQPNAFQAAVERKVLFPDKKMSKDPNDPSINIYEIKAMLPAF